jgi:hypothetical protein
MPLDSIFALDPRVEAGLPKKSCSIKIQFGNVNPAG